MDNFFIEYEPHLRLGSFLFLFAAVCFLEVFAPRRPLSNKRSLRWPNNLGLVALNTLILRFVFPLSAVGVALLSEEKSWGFFYAIEVPKPIVVVLCVIFLDMAIYTQHVVFHRVPILWRLHRMHHADTDYDVTLGARFHPIEIILSMLIKMSLIVAVGVPVAAVVLFEIILNGMAMFNHGNFKIPLGLDKVLRFFVVTPDMHRVHHSDIPAETHSNFGFNLSCWDRIFRTYIPQPKKGHEGMTLGLPKFRDSKYLKLPWMLKIPFERD